MASATNTIALNEVFGLPIDDKRRRWRFARSPQTPQSPESSLASIVELPLRKVSIGKQPGKMRRVVNTRRRCIYQGEATILPPCALSTDRSTIEERFVTNQRRNVSKNDLFDYHDIQGLRSL